MARKTDPPVVLIKWYDFTKWLLERIDSFPKNQRFIFGQRLADHECMVCLSWLQSHQVIHSLAFVSNYRFRNGDPAAHSAN